MTVNRTVGIITAEAHKNKNIQGHQIQMNQAVC